MKCARALLLQGAQGSRGRLEGGRELVDELAHCGGRHPFRAELGAEASDPASGLLDSGGGLVGGGGGLGLFAERVDAARRRGLVSEGVLAHGIYRPAKAGGRFSRKARTPSVRSSLAKAVTKSSR